MQGRIFLGRYQTIRLLGEGGMGRVYLARQIDLGRQVVVKVMHDHIAADPKFRERFQRETLLMARFQHPYVVTLYDASLNDPLGPCIVMEYIRGVTLDVLLKNNKGRLGPARVGRMLGHLCEALQAAHSEGIVHRDLKPGNLMVVDPDTPYEKIKVMDFGLAKLLDSEAIKKVTVTGGDFAVGTPTYICPEQVRGDPVDHRADLYSLGVILYELLTGRTPFLGESTMDILLAHATEDPTPLRDVDEGIDIPLAIEKVVMDCLAKNPAHRPPSARDLAERFETALAHEEVVQELALQAERPTAETGGDAPRGIQVNDPDALVYHLEAWMPEAIAVHKLRGFMFDVGGDVVESVPGKIRVVIGAGSTYELRGRGLSWLGLGRKATGRVEMTLHMQHAQNDRRNQLLITVVMRSLDGDSTYDPLWRALASQVYCDLRGYLMGKSGILERTNSA
jgi:serine/threonine-protein kinase